MEALVRDARLRRILRQVPHFLSGDVALEAKLDDMASTLGELLGASAVSAAVVDQMAEPTVRHVDLAGTTDGHDTLLDPAVRRRITETTDVVDLEHGSLQCLGYSLVA